MPQTRNSKTKLEALAAAELRAKLFRECSERGENNDVIIPAKVKQEVVIKEEVFENVDNSANCIDSSGSPKEAKMTPAKDVTEEVGIKQKLPEEQDLNHNKFENISISSPETYANKEPESPNDNPGPTNLDFVDHQVGNQSSPKLMESMNLCVSPTVSNLECENSSLKVTIVKLTDDLKVAKDENEVLKKTVEAQRLEIENLKRKPENPASSMANCKTDEKSGRPPKRARTTEQIKIPEMETQTLSSGQMWKAIVTITAVEDAPIGSKEMSQLLNQLGVRCVMTPEEYSLTKSTQTHCMLMKHKDKAKISARIRFDTRQEYEAALSTTDLKNGKYKYKVDAKPRGPRENLSSSKNRPSSGHTSSSHRISESHQSSRPFGRQPRMEPETGYRYLDTCVPRCSEYRCLGIPLPPRSCNPFGFQCCHLTCTKR